MPPTQQLLIDGHWRDAASGATHDVVNSYTREAVTTQAAAGAADVDAAVSAAAAVFPAWSALPGAERGALLSKAGDILESRGAQIAAAVSGGLAAGMVRAAGEVAQQPMEEEVASAIPGLRSRAVHQPLGVCVGIAPWNAPVILGTRAVVWALALGNTVVLKASEQSPRVHGAIVAA